MEIKSSAFGHNGDIPSKYTCDGEDINPPFVVGDLPENTKSLVLIMDDPDATAGITFDHWIMWNISPEKGEVGENDVPSGALQGLTGFGKNKYGGPCPPRGNASHRYMFKFYALDIMLDLPEGSKKSDVENAMQDHVLEQATIIGLYGR
ncbi:MAG: YbhB/YbcL family Raf kinase inhibitor-like protein [Candidatus Tagabacteria bacterium CG09_land_8_20_14_0_10_41_14]|uniref:YbhB/YbcL family Raf kinase inhibitor-like protein n=2 Tax=Candidatus Tagaibacteriota TaxID=1817918 RepID=A0A2H0WNG2_9BACT|nr:MAG: YbhB/YbcL family Raf kinase inhibitor-like protein [Candidatus Tagabacteria bacterium CG09_land_8_20_14_0_10_41_14]PJE73041.1 MAG: YbhB/YbcL family Raf kinase inhibitor-like protein [Candidatus Tagabacteria bacterium CG10_big_fil_rev_8_21_14_0_10_40_13]